MPLMKFIAPQRPRWLSILDAIGSELVSDSLVYRYNAQAFPDGLAEREGRFSMCTFWYVEALARAGRVDEARLIFEKMLTYANHLGLYAEEIGPTGEQLGNFPQAVTHLSLISAAVNLIVNSDEDGRPLAALLTMFRVAVRAPLACGANSTPTRQLEPGATGCWQRSSIR